MRVWWHFRGGEERPYLLAITRAEDIRAALEVFGEPFPCPFVRELTSPKILDRPEVQDLAAGAIAPLYVDQLPSAYDQYVLPDGRLDYEAMDRDGVNPR